MTEYSAEIIKKAKEALEQREIGLITKEEDVSKQSKNQDWMFFVISYIQLAKLGCDQILKNKDKGDLQNDYLIVPVLYNFKHSLELMMKVFTLILSNEYDGRSHNIKDLFDKLKDSIKGKLKKDEIEEIINKLYVLIYNYYFLKVIEEKISKSRLSLQDEKNTFFKYPENNISIQIDYSELVKNITEGEVLIISGDIVKAEGLFRQFGRLLREKRLL